MAHICKWKLGQYINWDRATLALFYLKTDFADHFADDTVESIGTVKQTPKNVNINNRLLKACDTCGCSERTTKTLRDDCMNWNSRCLTLQDDICRIRQIRNEILHSSTTQLGDDTFEDLTDQMISILRNKPKNKERTETEETIEKITELKRTDYPLTAQEEEMAFKEAKKSLCERENEIQVLIHDFVGSSELHKYICPLQETDLNRLQLLKSGVHTLSRILHREYRTKTRILLTRDLQKIETELEKLDLVRKKLAQNVRQITRVARIDEKQNCCVNLSSTDTTDEIDIEGDVKERLCVENFFLETTKDLVKESVLPDIITHTPKVICSSRDQWYCWVKRAPKAHTFSFEDSMSCEILIRNSRCVEHDCFASFVHKEFPSPILVNQIIMYILDSETKFAFVPTIGKMQQSKSAKEKDLFPVYSPITCDSCDSKETSLLSFCSKYLTARNIMEISLQSCIFDSLLHKCTAVKYLPFDIEHIFRDDHYIEIPVTDINHLYMHSLNNRTINPMILFNAWHNRLTHRSLGDKRHNTVNIGFDILCLFFSSLQKHYSQFIDDGILDSASNMKDIRSHNGENIALHKTESNDSSIDTQETYNAPINDCVCEESKTCSKDKNVLSKVTNNQRCKPFNETIDLKTRQNVDEDLSVSTKAHIPDLGKEDKEKTDFIKQVITGNFTPINASSTYVVAPVTGQPEKQGSNDDNTEAANSNESENTCNGAIGECEDEQNGACSGKTENQKPKGQAVNAVDSVSVDAGESLKRQLRNNTHLPTVPSELVVAHVSRVGSASNDIESDNLAGHNFYNSPLKEQQVNTQSNKDINPRQKTVLAQEVSDTPGRSHSDVNSHLSVATSDSSATELPTPVVDPADIQQFEPLLNIIDKIANGERVPPQITMQYEMLRFCTLRSYPKVNKPYITRLAQAGFYYANSADEVVCYCCARRKRNWQENDIPMDVHRQLNPNCKFLLKNSEVNVPVKTDGETSNRLSNLRASSNMPTMSSSPQGHTAFQGNQNGHHTNASSEVNIPENTHQQQIALSSSTASGMSNRNEVQRDALVSSSQRSIAANDTLSRMQTRAHGNFVLASASSPVDNERRQHATTSNKAFEHLAGGTGITTSQTSGGGTTQNAMPKYPKYASKTVRVTSFTDCSEIVVSPESLSEAGFFYAGFGDCVRCFQCGVGLRHWSEEDDPWIEHSRWSKDCSFVRQMRGQEFVNLVQMAVQYSQHQSNQQNSGQRPSETTAESNQGGNGGDEVENLMHADSAQSVLEMGYHPDLIRRAIRAVLAGNGRQNVTATTLMEKIFEIEAENPTIAEQNGEVVAHNDQSALAAAAASQQTAPSRSEEQASGTGSAHSESHTPSGTQQPVKAERQNEATAEHTRTSIEEPSVPTFSEGSEMTKTAKKSQQLLEQKRLKEENEKLKQQSICTKCKEKDVCIVFLPCGHLVTCETCAPTVRYCTMQSCGKYIKGTVRTYLA